MKSGRMLAFTTILWIVGVLSFAVASSEKRGLGVIKTDHPRDTMLSFMTAMNDYKKGRETDNAELEKRIQDAVRCLNLDDVPFILRQEKGRESAVFLKEVIDRVLILDYSKIPEKSPDEKKPLLSWRLKGTEITLVLVASGERAGEYLFSKDTVFRAKEFYEKVAHLPYLKNSGGGALYQQPWLESAVPGWSRKGFLGLEIWQWLGILGSILLGFVLKSLVRYIVDWINRLASRSGTQWDNRLISAVSAPVGYLAASGFWFVSLHLLRLEGKILSFFTILIQIIFSAVAVWVLYRLTAVLGDYLLLLAKKTESTLDDQLVPLINRTLKIFIVILGVLISIQNLGVNVMSVLAGLGIGGLAFALAAKDMVANLFGSIMILLDRPFQVGDWIKISSVEGMVQEIGFRSTRIRTFYDSVISVPNSELANQKIDNMGQREYRRVVSYLGLTYDTPAEKIEVFMEGIKNIVKANPYTRKDLFHVAFNRFGAHSLDVMLYFFLSVPDWGRELVETQNIYLEILRLAERLNVAFAFPTQSLHVESMPGEKGTPTPKVNARDWKEKAEGFGPGGKFGRPQGSGLFIPPYADSDLQKT